MSSKFGPKLGKTQVAVIEPEQVSQVEFERNGRLVPVGFVVHNNVNVKWQLTDSN